MFYPEIAPFHTCYLQVSAVHTLYVEQVGNPLGIPIVFLHGGPGAGLAPKHREFFDPKKFWVILFDQRGCGQSTPYGELEENTTHDLIADIERIRLHLGIASWHVFGGSWGSFLALAYAQVHPRVCRSLILRGLFLGRKEEISFFYQRGASFIFPEAFEKFVSILSEQEQKDILTSFYHRLHSSDPQVVSVAARHWSTWEASCLKLVNTEASTAEFAQEGRLMSLAKLETHYFYHNCFVAPSQLLHEAYRLNNIPITVVHGRYDMVCPVENAYFLKKALPHIDLKIASRAGHSGSEPEILEFLQQALEAISD